MTRSQVTARSPCSEIRPRAMTYKATKAFCNRAASSVGGIPDFILPLLLVCCGGFVLLPSPQDLQRILPMTSPSATTECRLFFAFRCESRTLAKVELDVDTFLMRMSLQKLSAPIRSGNESSPPRKVIKSSHGSFRNLRGWKSHDMVAEKD